MSPTTTQSPIGDVMCEDVTPQRPGLDPLFPRIFPPGDADADTRRAWLAASPWPEVVFASAG